MVTETGLHVEITADIAQFDAKLKAAQARLTATSTTFAEFSGVFPKLEGNIKNAQRTLSSMDKTLDKAAASAKTLDTGLKAADIQLKNYGRNAAKSTQHTANLTAQINDIGVMLQAGQSPFMLAIQQGTQMNQVLDNMGTTGKERIKAVGSALMAAVSPANLLTVGIIAGGAALAQWAIRAMSAADETDSFKLSLDEARDSVAEMNEKLRLANLGRTAQEDALIRALETERAVLREQEALLVSLEQQAAEYKKQMGAASLALEAQVAIQRDLIAAVQRRIAEAEKELAVAQQSSAEYETQSAAARELSDIERMLGEQMAEVARQNAIAAAEMERLRDAAMAAAREFMIVQGFRSRFAGEEAVMAQDVLQPGRGEPAQETKKAGGAAVADTLATDLEALQAALMTAEEAQLASFVRQQEILEAALEKQLLTRQEYNELMLRAQGEHQAAMTQIDAYAYGNNVDKLAAFMGDAASVLAEGNEDMLKISRAFAAAQALISTLQGAAKELEKGTFGFAQAAAVIAKGMSFITAINGVTAGSASAGTAAAADTTGSTAAGTAAATTSAQVAIQLSGGDMFSRDQVISLINSINEAVEDGAELRLV